MPNLKSRVLQFNLGNMSYDIPYFEIQKTINNEKFRKYFIIDIRTMPIEELQFIFANFEDFNTELLEHEFFLSHQANMIVLFVYNEEFKYAINIYEALDNMKFAFKKFVTEAQLSQILQQCDCKTEDMKIAVKNTSLTLSHFNLIYGGNGSGKSVLLQKIADNYHIPIYNMSNLGDTIDHQIEQKDFLQNIKKKLNEMNAYPMYSKIGMYLKKLGQILALHKESGDIILLDDLGWNALDERNKINLIDTLYEYTLEESVPVVLTSCQQDVKRLVKLRTRKPNIIEMDKTEKNYSLL